MRKSFFLFFRLNCCKFISLHVFIFLTLKLNLDFSFSNQLVLINFSFTTLHSIRNSVEQSLRHRHLNTSILPFFICFIRCFASSFVNEAEIKAVKVLFPIIPFGIFYVTVNVFYAERMSVWFKLYYIIFCFIFSTPSFIFALVTHGLYGTCYLRGTHNTYSPYV